MKKLLSLILFLILSFSLVACAETEPAAEIPAAAPVENSVPAAEEVEGVTVPEFAFMINGVKVDHTMMAAYPLYSVVTNTVNNNGAAFTDTYVGFAIRDVYEAAGLTEDYVWLEATADDGYTITVTGDLVNADVTLLAVTKNGEQFKTSPWFAPCGSGTTGDYLKNMVSIQVSTAEGIDNALPAETTEGA